LKFVFSDVLLRVNGLVFFFLNVIAGIHFEEQIEGRVVKI
jgi:hypothetical protein